MAKLFDNFRKLFGNMTALHKAAERQDMAELSLQVQMHPSDVNAQEAKMGWTPLHVAADKGFDSGVRELLLRGSNPDIQDKDGRTALHIAADQGCRKVVEGLLRRGASTTLRDNCGRVPYDCAVQRHPAIAALLGGAAGAATAVAAEVAPPPPSPLLLALPLVDLPSAMPANLLMPPAPPTLTSLMSQISKGPSGSSFPQVRHDQTPAEPALPSPPWSPPPPPSSSSSSHVAVRGLSPAGPGAAADVYGPHAAVSAAAAQAQTYTYQRPYPYGHQAATQEGSTARIPYPVVSATQLSSSTGRHSSAINAGSNGSTVAGGVVHEPTYPKLFQQPLAFPVAPPLPPTPLPDPTAPSLLLPPPPQPISSLALASSEGRVSMGAVVREQPASPPPPPPPARNSVSINVADDLDWGPGLYTDWGDEPETYPPPPVPSRPEFNPIMSARTQLEKLLGAGLSHFGIQPPRPAGPPLPVPAASTNIDPQVNATSAASGLSLRPSTASVVSTTLVASRIYSYEDLLRATGNFHPLNKLGEGGYGPVYRGWLDGIPVAVKVMDTSEGCMQGRTEFEAEVNILSSLHHPHVVLLIGSCPEKGILVYELMPNGSLENNLFGADGSTGTSTGDVSGSGAGSGAAPSPQARTASSGNLSWRHRVRIAAEVASALLFLHTAPRPIVHMDLKPANILLDTHLTAKLGDVGLARLAPMLDRPAGPTGAAMHSGGKSTAMDSRLVGTFEYMDPVYMQTAQYSPRSDVYALGMVMLQMLTGKVGKQVIAQVEGERRDPLGFGPCIDPRAGPWPAAEAAAFADLALRCVAYSHQDRPDLRSVILPTLTQLKQRTQLYEQAEQPSQLYEQAEQPSQLPPPQQDAAPPMFVCPITQDVMNEPVVAADGYTYEKLAIMEWIRRSRTSPLTNLPLDHTNLVENRTLRSAIQEWRQQHTHFKQQQQQLRNHFQQQDQQQQYVVPTAEATAAAAQMSPPPSPPLQRHAVAPTADYGGW